MKITWNEQEIELPAEFIAWLESFLGPDWQSEYTGNIYAMYMAWEAGRNFCASFH